MAVQLRLVVLVVIVSVLLSYRFSAGLNYFVVLTDIKCSHNAKYAANSSCELSEPAPSAGASFDMQMKKEVKMFRIDLYFYLERMKKHMLLFKAPDLDVCIEFHKKQTAIYLEMFKEMTQRAGKWPKCPIEADFYYKFVNITPNPIYLPPYLPQVGFKMTITMKDKKEMIMNTAIMGKVIHKQSIKAKTKN